MDVENIIPTPFDYFGLLLIATILTIGGLAYHVGYKMKKTGTKQVPNEAYLLVVLVGLGFVLAIPEVIKSDNIEARQAALAQVLKTDFAVRTINAELFGTSQTELVRILVSEPELEGESKTLRVQVALTVSEAISLKAELLRHQNAQHEKVPLFLPKSQSSG